MNICIISGKIISEVEFEFIINNKNKSIAYFDIELSNKNIVKIKAYDEIADYCYWKFEKGEIIYIQGFLKGTGEILVQGLPQPLDWKHGNKK